MLCYVDFTLCIKHPVSPHIVMLPEDLWKEKANSYIYPCEGEPFKVKGVQCSSLTTKKIVNLLKEQDQIEGSTLIGFCCTKVGYSETVTVSK